MPKLLSPAQRCAPAFILCLLLLSQTGCYYTHLASGQLKILWRRTPIEDVLRDPALAPETRQLLETVGAVRDFAAEIGLHVDGQYTSYVEWPGDRIVTTLVRTRRDSIEVVDWWFPVLGNLPYKGFFDRARAEAEAERLRESGEYEVCVSGVTAYSTLGWVDDPVTSPMLQRGAASLVETLLHELVHATAYLAGEADFNEGIAQFIGQEAAVRFFAQASLDREPDRDTDLGRDGHRNRDTDLDRDGHRDRDADLDSETDRDTDTDTDRAGRLPDAERVRRAIADRRAIAARTIEFREQLLALADDPERPQRRAQAEAETRAALAAMPLAVLDAQAVSRRARLSDPCLALRGTYVRDLPRHAALLAALDGNLEALIARLALWADEKRDVEAFFAL